MSGQKGRGNPEELPGLLAELRELVREAHSAIKDLDRLTGQSRRIGDELEAALEARLRRRFETMRQELDEAEQEYGERVMRRWQCRAADAGGGSGGG